MAEKKIKSDKLKTKYIAVNPKEFAEMHNDIVPCYKELCDGEAVELDENNKIVIGWLYNKIIKEI